MNANTGGDRRVFLLKRVKLAGGSISYQEVPVNGLESVEITNETTRFQNFFKENGGEQTVSVVNKIKGLNVSCKKLIKDLGQRGLASANKKPVRLLITNVARTEQLESNFFISPTLTSGSGAEQEDISFECSQTGTLIVRGNPLL